MTNTVLRVLTAVALATALGAGCGKNEETPGGDAGSTTSDMGTNNPDGGANNVDPGTDAGSDLGGQPDGGADSGTAQDMGSADMTGPPPVGGVFPGIPEYPYRDQLPALDAPVDITNCDGNGTTVNGTPDNWMVVTLDQDSRCELSGSYFVVQNSTLTHRLNMSGGPYAVRNSEIVAPGTGGALNPGGTEILIEGNVVRDNGVIPSSADHHGLNVPGSTQGLWILSNSIFGNSGDAIQFCHNCIGDVHDGPASVYIAGNVMHDDEENAIDLKEFLGPVVVVCNEMYGYEAGQFSGNGEAVRINDEGQQGQVWFAHNDYHDNMTDVAPYNSEAEGYFLDENATNINNSNSNTVFAEGADAQQYYDQYQAEYGLDLSGDCPQP